MNIPFKLKSKFKSGWMFTATPINNPSQHDEEKHLKKI